MRFLSFTSGSCGNCALLLPEKGKGLLIDAGISPRSVKRILREKGLDEDCYDTIIVTHNHMDHVRFLGSFCKQRMPLVCAPSKLHGVLAGEPLMRDYIARNRLILRDGEWNRVGQFDIFFFEVKHDAAQTVGYALECEGHKVVFMTDLEAVPPIALEFASQADTVVIESNYDYDMLIHGDYPPQLKRRILDEGHLSNDDAAAAIKSFCSGNLRNLFLCHLSGNNNTPRLAYDCARSALLEAGAEEGRVSLRVLPRGVPSPVVTL